MSDDGHHTNEQRILFHSVQTAYWACQKGNYEAAAVALSNGLSVYQPDA